MIAIAGERNQTMPTETNAVKKATLGELQALSWLPDTVAEAVYERFHTPS